MTETRGDLAKVSLSLEEKPGVPALAVETQFARGAGNARVF